MNWGQINERFVNPAVNAWKANKIREAETLFKQGLVTTGNDGYVALTYAHFLESCGRLKEAEEMFEVALKKLPLLELKQKAKVGIERVNRRSGTHKPQSTVTGTPAPILDSRKRYPAEYRTADGKWVRSKSEKIIADWLYNNHMRCEYERKIMEGVTCDFYLPEVDVYIEYWGKDDEAYRKYRKRKEEIYSKLGIRLLSLDDTDLKHIDDVLRSKLGEAHVPNNDSPYLSGETETEVRSSLSRNTMKLNPVGQVSLGAKSIKIMLTLKEIDQTAALGGIATFYVNLDYLKKVIDGKTAGTQISQLVPKTESDKEQDR